MTKLAASGGDLCVGRVVSEDDKWLLLEIPKSDQEKFTLQDGDRFLTVLFVRKVGERMQAWKPWLSDEREAT